MASRKVLSARDGMRCTPIELVAEGPTLLRSAGYPGEMLSNIIRKMKRG